MQLTMVPVLDASILVASFLVKLVGYHATLKLLGRGASHLNIVRSLLVTTIVIVTGMHGIPRVVDLLPPGTPYLALAATGAFLFLCTLLLTRVICDTKWFDAMAATVVLVSLSMALDYYIPRITVAVLPEGTSFDEYRKQADAAIAKARAMATNDVNRNAPGFLAEGLDALATLTTKQEQRAMKADLLKGLQMYAERKKLMEQMTTNELAEYRQEMAKFLAEQGISSNLYSLAKIRHIDTNDIATIAAALQEMRDSQTHAGASQHVRPITESLAMISSNLTSLNMTPEDAELLHRAMTLFSHDDLTGAVAAVQADLGGNAGKENLAIAVFAAMSKLEAASLAKAVDLTNVVNSVTNEEEDVAEEISTGTNTTISLIKIPEALPLKQDEPKEAVVPVAFEFGAVKFSAKMKDEDAWIDAADSLPLKGYTRVGNRAAVILTDHTILDIGDRWQGASGNVKYTFVLEAVEKGRVTLRACGSGIRDKEKGESAPAGSSRL